METKDKTQKVVIDYSKYIGKLLLLGPSTPPNVLCFGNNYVRPIEAEILQTSATNKWFKIRRVSTGEEQWHQAQDFEILDLIS